jgi:CheY-like chemotaxis protein
MANITQTAGKTLEALLVDDNRTDAVLIREALKHCRLPVNLSDIQDGALALDYLCRLGNYAQTPEVDLVLLDLNMPRMNGWDVLTAMKADYRLSSLPVLIVTSSRNADDARKAYGMDAESYLVKPPNLFEFPMLLKTIERIFAEPHRRLG